MTALAERNGHALPDVDPYAAFEKQVAEQVDGMRTLLAEQRSITRQLEAELAEQKEREKRIEKALAALQGNASASAPRRQARPDRAAGAERKRYASEDAIARVRAALGEHGEQRKKDLQEHTGLSQPTIAQALEILREREEVRITRAENQSKFYALMPGATDGA